MDAGALEELRSQAEAQFVATAALADVQPTATVEWFHLGADSASASAYRNDAARCVIGLNQDIIERWFGQLTREQANRLFAGLTHRAIAAYIFGPPQDEWAGHAELHIWSEQDQGLDEDYARAFHAAHRILESHRLDQRLLALEPDAAAPLAEWIRFELHEHPEFDIYPRAAIVMGRPDLPADLVQPAFDEFVDQFGIDEADELKSMLNGYVALPPDAIDDMVEQTGTFIFHAFPEALGLGWFDEDGDGPAADELWDLKGQIPDDDVIGWNELERFIAASLAQFAGQAGLDFGDTLLIGLDENALVGPRIGAWARGTDLALDLANLPLPAQAHSSLIDRGWEPFRNAPESFHKQAATGEAGSVAHEVVWILRDLTSIPTPANLTIWGRGPAPRVARDRGWSLDDIEPAAGLEEPLVAYPSDHEALAELVRASLRDVIGEDPEEYGPGRFLVDPEGLEIAVLATDDTFPAIRLHHRALDAPDELREELIEFANALHGRTSTIGSHWWLGNSAFWQVCEFWAGKFDQEIFTEQLQRFINVACDRTPEIRARFGPADDGTPSG